MSGNGHVVAATWRAEDFADLETLNEPMAVDIFEGQKPPVLIDSRGYEQFAFLGATGNPCATAAVEAFFAHRRQLEVVQASGTPEDPAAQAVRVWDLQDKILAAIHVTPRYCPKSHLVEGRPPAGQLWWGSYTGDQRRALVDFFYNSAEAIKPFRARSRADEPTALPGDGVSPTPESHPDPARSAVSEVVAGRSGADVANGAGPSGERQPTVDIRAE